MKQKNRFLNTVFIIFLGLILVSMFKYFHFLKQPEFIQVQYQSFASYPGVGGILSMLTITGAMFLVINIWKKTKEEKLIENGKENEVQKIKKLFLEGLLTEKEVDKKYDILLNELKIETEVINRKLKSERENELIEQLSKLKNQGLLTETEFELKKEQVLSGKRIETE